MTVSLSTVRGSNPTTLRDGSDDVGRKYSELEALITGERDPRRGNEAGG